MVNIKPAAYDTDFFQRNLEGSLRSAREVVPLVLGLLHPTSVVDIGCGAGTWLAAFRELGVEDTLGLDGTYVQPEQLLIPPEYFQAVDLAEPFSLPRTFDLALSLEVAEHLPESVARHFVQSLCRLAPVILFSAAVPGQLGRSHVNEQWPWYWQSLFSNEHFVMVDAIRHLTWHNSCIEWWYRQNMFLFVQCDLLTHRHDLQRLPRVPDREFLTLVTSTIIDRNCNPGLRKVLARLPKLTAEVFRARVDKVKRRMNAHPELP